MRFFCYSWFCCFWYCCAWFWYFCFFCHKYFLIYLIMLFLQILMFYCAVGINIKIWKNRVWFFYFLFYSVGSCLFLQSIRFHILSLLTFFYFDLSVTIIVDNSLNLLCLWFICVDLLLEVRCFFGWRFVSYAAVSSFDVFKLSVKNFSCVTFSAPNWTRMLPLFFYGISVDVKILFGMICFVLFIILKSRLFSLYFLLFRTPGNRFVI